MAPSSALVPIEYVLRLLDQAEEAGCDIDALLEELQLSKSDLVSNKEILALTYGQIYRSVMFHTQDEWFGIFAADRVPLGAFRLMGLTLLSCTTLRQAIIRSGEFSDICRGLQVRYLLQEEDSNVVLTLSPTRSLEQSIFDEKVANAYPESLAASIISTHRLSEWLIGKEIPLKKVTVTFNENLDEIPLDFPACSNVEYGAATNSFQYDAKFLEFPIIQNQDTWMAFLRVAPYHLVAEDPAHVSTADKVRNILTRDVSGSMPSAESVASQLNVSVTTLRRQLQKDNTSYQAIKDDCRMKAAYHYLSCADLSNNDIAELLGFDEPSAFFRSFKKWTGKTPGEFRASLKSMN